MRRVFGVVGGIFELFLLFLIVKRKVYIYVIELVDSLSDWFSFFGWYYILV